MTLLEVKNLNSYYGKSHVVYDVNIGVDQGEIVAIVGRNGVGKTTILKSIMSLVEKKDSKITFKNLDITDLPTYKISRNGIGFIPDRGGVFLDLTVEENFKLAQRKGGYRFEDILDIFPQIKPLLKRKGAHLSGGERRLVGISRALLMSQDLLLIDEPSEGLAPSIVKEIAKILLELKEKGISILFADQNPTFILDVSDRIYVIDNGQVKTKGYRDEITKDLLEKYLSI